ncbi:hypothetical protein GCM10009582_10210 [Arthrobacter flavus]
MPLLAPLRTFTPHDDMYGEGALTVALQLISKPLGYEASFRATLCPVGVARDLGMSRTTFYRRSRELNAK